MSHKLSFLLISVLLSTYFASAQKFYLFVGSYNENKDSSGIYVYRFDPANGQLQPVTTAKGMLNPSYLTLSQDGNYIYTAAQSKSKDDGRIGSYVFDRKKGSVGFINEQSSGGANPVYVTTHKNGQWLVNGNYSGSSLSVFPLNDDGSLGAAKQVIPFVDSSVMKSRQKQSHIHAVFFSPDFRYVFSPDLGADKIRGYRFDEQQEEPLRTTDHPFTRTAPGSGPRHMAFHPNGKFVYSIEEMSGTVTAYKYAADKLDSIQTITAHVAEGVADYGSADIHFSPDGRFLYATTRGKENLIFTYSVNARNGRLKVIASEGTGGNHPRNFVIDPTGKFLLVANMISGNVVVFERNMKTGRLRKTGTELTMKGPSCLKFREYAD